MNEYDDLIKADKSNELRSSMFAATKQQPDQEAVAQKLADRWGLPVETVRAKRPEVEFHDKLESFDYEKAIKENPKLSAWLADPKNAGVAHDDFDQLSGMEKLFAHGKDYAGAFAQGVVGQGIGSTLSGISTLIDVGARTIDRPIRSAFGDKVANAFWYEPARIGGMATDPFQALKDAGSAFKQAGNAMAPPQSRQTLGTDVAGGIGQLGFQIGAFLMTGGAASGAMLMSQGADVMADKTAKDIANPALKDTAILAGGAITKLTEQYGIDKILNRVPPEIRNRTLRFIADKFAAGGIEAAQEFTEGLLHDITRRVLTNENAELLQGVDREMSAAALSAAIVRTALGVKGFRSAQQNEEFFKALGDQATAAKLATRSPSHFRDLIAKYTEGGPVENVFIPAEKFSEYFQSVGIDPVQAAAESGAKNFQEAMANGGDVVISMADFTTNIAPTDHLQGLMPDLRLRQDEMTSREAKMAEANRDESDKALQAEIAAINEAAKSEAGLSTAIQRIVTDVEGQLIGRYDPNTARQMATVMRGMAVLATRANPNADPVEAAQALWSKYGLNIRANPLPDVLTKAQNFDAAIDPMLDRLRKGDVPSERDINGATLLDFVREAGGLMDQGGELASRDAALWDKENRKGGQRRLVSQNGQSLDGMRELALEAGYPVGQTEADFIDAIDREIRGEPVFKEGAGENDLRRVADDLGALSKALSDMGVDLAAMDNAAVKKLLRGGENEFEQGLPDQIEIDGVLRSTLNSAGKPIAQTQEGLRNFWRWFGDSKVVDAEGRPLVVYHGTAADIESFDTEKVGSNFGKDEKGFFFTNSGMKAARYADTESVYALNDMSVTREPVAGSNTIPVYLSIKNPLTLEKYTDAYYSNPDVKIGEEGISVTDYFDDNTESVIAMAERDDHDGITFSYKGDLFAVAFKPEQIKSATGNRGTFDPADANILYQDDQRYKGAPLSEWTADTALIDAAKKYFGTTIRPLEAGYVLPDGTMLDFTGRHETSKDNWPYMRDQRSVDHRMLAGENMSGFSMADMFESNDGNEMMHEFMARTGAMRVDFSAAVTSIMRPPTAAQLNIIARNIGREYAAASYVDGESGRIIADAEWDNVSGAKIKNFFAENKDKKPDARAALFQGEGTKRGSIQFGADRKFQINLFEKADLSTFLHESGHFYLEVLGDLAADPASDQSVRDDYAKILAFMGVSNRSEIKVEHHEKFARANEAYLMEGKAPSPELRGVFQRFRGWLKLIYRQLQSLNVELTDEVRGVFDRVYATDLEIEQAEREAKLQTLFLDAKTAGMTDAEFDAYRDNVASTTADAKEELQTKLMRVEKLKREAWWREERARVADEVAAEFDALPAAQALERMAATDSDLKLDKDALVRLYGADVLKTLPRGYGEGRGAIYANDGVDLDSAAEILGFDSADSMLTALGNLPPRGRFIAAESDRIMGERHGDLLNDIALADEAVLALHNEKREAVLKIELRALNRSIKADMVPAESLRAMAAGIIGQKQVRDIAPHSYLIAEQKAAREAFKEMAEGGDRMKAFKAKQRELLNHYLYREATRAKQEAEKIRVYLKGFESDKRRGEIGKAGADYLDQIDSLLERYEFKRVTQKAMDKRESLTAWLNRQEAEGHAVSVPEEIQNDARAVNWQQVSIDELRAVRDSVKNIAHLANLKNKLLRKGKMIDFDMVVGDLLNAIETSGLESTGELGLASDKEASIAQKGAAMWRRFDAAHMKVEQLVSWLDGGKIDGPWARYFFDLADDAQTQEYDLHREVTQKIKALSDGMPKPWRHGLMDRTTIRLPGFSQTVTRYTLISIAMNMGNAQNLQRLTDGYGWQPADFDAIRGALTAQDWKYVQGVWDAIETLWPHMAALEKRMSGLEPAKVEAVSFEVGGQTYRGGYFPLVYDPRKSEAGEKQADEAESIQNFVAQGYGRAATNKGATIKRVENFKAPVMLDYEQVLTSHLAKVIKDISHREAVLGINKILAQGDIKQALIDRAGEANYAELRKWLQVLIADRADTLHQASGMGRMVMVARTNMAIVTMGWKISTMMAQFAGFGPSMDTVKPSYLAKAMIQTVKHPADTWAMVQEKSGEMRNRSNTLERDAKDALTRMRGKGGMLADVQRTAFYLTAMADRMVSVPTWIGAYNQALAEGKQEEDAVRAGDRAVRLSQGSGGSKDLAAVQRNNELMKLLTMYYTPFSVLYARLRDVGHQSAVQGIGYLPAAAARLLALVVLPAVLGDLLAARGPDEDEDETWWAIRKILLYPLASVPVVRDFSGYLEAGIISASGEGEMKFPPSYKLSPVVGAIEKIAKTPAKIAGAMDGSKEFDSVAWDTFEASGLIFGLPTGQVRITGEYLEDLLTGDAQPENAAELMRDALFKRQKP